MLFNIQKVIKFIIQILKNNPNRLKMVFLGFLVGLHSPLYSIFPLYPLFFVWALFKGEVTSKQRFFLCMVYSGFLHLSFFLLMFRPVEIHFTNFFLFQEMDNVFIIFFVFFLLCCWLSLYFGYFYEFLAPWLFMLLIILAPRPIAYMLVVLLFVFGFIMQLDRLCFAKIIYSLLVLLFFIALKAQVFPDLLPPTLLFLLSGAEIPIKQCSKVFCFKMMSLEHCSQYAKMYCGKFYSTSTRYTIVNAEHSAVFHKIVADLKNHNAPRPVIDEVSQTTSFHPILVDQQDNKAYPLTSKGGSLSNPRFLLHPGTPGTNDTYLWNKFYLFDKESSTHVKPSTDKSIAEFRESLKDPIKEKKVSLDIQKAKASGKIKPDGDASLGKAVSQEKQIVSSKYSFYFKNK